MILNRRQFVSSAASCAAMRFGMGSEVARAETPFVPFFLTVYCSGGWDQTMVFDSKIGGGYAAQESGATAATGAGSIPYVAHGSRPSVKTFFDTFGANAAIVNGISAGTMTKTLGIANMMTVLPPGKTRRVDWASHYVSALNPLGQMPHVVLDAPYCPGDLTSIAVRVTKQNLSEYGVAVPGVDTLGAEGEAALAKFRSAAISPSIAANANGQSLDAEKLRALYYASARHPLISAKIPQVLQTLGDQGTDDDFVRSGKIAIELFHSSSSQAATIQCGLDDAWDTRTNHYATHSQNFETLFSGLNKILSYAITKGIGDKMLIVVLSERGRNPRLNAQGGKGPWPFTSVLLWGVGIRGGTVAGVTDDALRGLPVNPVFGTVGGAGSMTLTMQNVMAALYLKTDVPPRLILPDVQPLAQILASEA